MPVVPHFYRFFDNGNRVGCIVQASFIWLMMYCTNNLNAARARTLSSIYGNIYNTGICQETFHEIENDTISKNKIQIQMSIKLTLKYPFLAKITTATGIGRNL
jgi:hypothetical protein